MSAEVVRHWRQANHEGARRIRFRQQARTKTMRQLARLHPEEFERLYTEQLAMVDEPPSRGPGRRLPPPVEAAP